MTNDAPARHSDTDRNVILNRALMDLDRIINGHDPENDTSLNNLVWDRLDQMAVEIEARLRAEAARIADDYHPERGQEVLALAEMREAISTMAQPR